MNLEDNCAVYVHVNLINGKKYFGITTWEPERRWGKNGDGYFNNDHFTNAIKKYSWDNFAHYVLYRNIPIKIAKNIEEMLIKEHMSYDPMFGYNKTMGGELERPSEETRKKIREATKEAMNRPEVRKKISESMKEFCNNHPWESPMKNPEVAKKNARARSKPVEAIDQKTGLRVHYFESTQSAGLAGFSQGNISECCNGKRKTHKGYCWRFVREVNKDDTNSGQ